MTLTLHLRLFTVSEGRNGVNPAMGRPDLSFGISDSASFRGQKNCESWRRVFSIQNGHIGACCRSLSMSCVFFFLCELQTNREYLQT